MKLLFKKIIKKTVWFSCWIVILSAALLSAARLLTPLLDKHRDQFASIASRVLERPVLIKQLSASWYHFEPVLRFKEVTVLDPQTAQPILNVDEFTISFNLLKSLWHWRLEPDSLILQGSNIRIEQTASGQVTLNGFIANSTTNQPAITLEQIYGWLFSHGQIVLKKINIDSKLNNVPIKLLTINSVSLKNEGKQHYVRGHVVIRHEPPTPIYFAANIKTKENFSHVESAQLYVRTKRLNLPIINIGKLINGQQYTWQIAKGHLTGQIWALWEKHHWQRFQAKADLSDLSLNQGQGKLAKINQLKGDFWLQRKADQGWEMVGNNVQLTLNGKLWPENKFQLMTSNQDNHQQLAQLQVKYIQLADITPLVLQTGLLPEKWQAVLKRLYPQGELSHVLWRKDPRGIVLTSQFSDLSFRQWGQVPGATHLSGSVQLLPTSGIIEFDGLQTTLDFNSLFKQPLLIEQLHSRLYLQKMDSGWWLTAKNMTANTTELWLHANLGIYIPSGQESPTIQLIAALSMPNAQHAARYYPVGIMHQHLTTWLQTAIVQAKNITGTLVLRGPLHSFPFTDHTGVFNINGHIQDAILTYHPNWPQIKQLNAELNFTGRSMRVNATQGSILDAKLQQAQATIKNLTAHPEIDLQVSGQLKGDARQGVAFIQESPLSTTLGKHIAMLKLQGGMQTNLNLNIPLANSGKHVPAKIQGTAKLQNASLQIPLSKLPLEQLNGWFDFSEQGLMAGQLEGQLLKQPLQIKISHTQDKGAMTSEINMQGNLQMQALADYLAWQPLTNFSGQMAYQAILKIQNDKQQQLQQALTLTTQLKDVAIPLPAPFAKRAGQLKPLTISLILHANKPYQLTWDYNKQFNGNIELQQNEQGLKLLGGVINIGDRASKLAQDNKSLVIAGQLARFDWLAWQPWFESWHKLHKQQPAKSTPIQIHLYIKELAILKQVFNEALIKVRTKPQDWLLSIISQQAQGKVLFPYQAGERIEADFNKLHLHKNDATSMATVNTNDIPFISFSCLDFQYDEKQLGSVQLELIPNAEELTFKQISVHNPAFSLAATGSWLPLAQQDYTHIAGKMVINDLAAAQQMLGVNPSLSSKRSEADFDLTWYAKPYAFDLATLQGNVNLKLGPGQILNIDSNAASKIGVGKFINILGVESLARKLSLNFHDLTDKGFGFNKMEGTFQLIKGNAYTENAFFDGNVAYVGLKGRIGLAQRDYDLSLKVAPYLTSSLPIIATLAGGPIVGAVSLVAERLLKHEVDQITAYNYELTGAWDKPQLISKHS